VTATLLTYEDYLTYDDGTDVRYELEEGRLIAMSPTADIHEAIANELHSSLTQEVQRLQLGWKVRASGTAVRTAKRKVRLADLVVITAEQRESLRGQLAILETPPLLVVEVVSPESVRRDYRYKRTEYAAMEIPEYWIVDPLVEKVTILQFVEGLYEEQVFHGEHVIISPTFPELRLTAHQVLVG